MNASFADALAKLAEQKRDLLAEVETWPTQSLSSRPSPSEWSVLEMTDHLIKTEIAILGSVREGLNKPHRIGLIDTVRSHFVQWIFMPDRACA